MAKTHHKSETDTPTNKSRRYTVDYIRDHLKHRPSPSITLRCHWMAELGFDIGQKVEVITTPGQMIIRLAAAE
ncbi:type I toxin-antitoxin system SymE family toxin [Pantoea dispersa]|jgi:toxic protein SymE|uniref:SymE family type I addiction module toxin n=1 Tax=Pantoea dispersa TaxID=59814 RepID=UPI0021B02D59|nr:type I toxin-antitoxin system SymE family toxin [Pantoea dispersa]MCT6589363.1 type I toxin-antitoxin system SymE family toxin [Pantoea dispersa]MDT8848888.1 type I toxin-antitoxin system SymE family toxin [Pantoea dispersa]